MANEKLQYIVELLTQGDTKRATDELKKLELAGKGSTDSLAGLKSGLLTLFAAFGGMQVINQSIDAFLEQEKAIAKLNAALASTGQLTPETSKQMQELAGSLSQVSSFADEAILNVIAKLTAMGAKTTDVERLTKATLDLSTLMDGDLNTAARQMALAIGGAGAQAFDRLKLNIDQTLPPSEQFMAALIEIEKRAGGQSAAAVENLGGKFSQMTKEVGELKEAFGGLIVTGIGPFINSTTDAVKELSKFIENFKEMGELIKSLSPDGGLLSGFFSVSGNSSTAQANFLKKIAGLKTSSELAAGEGQAPLPKDLFNQTGSLDFMKARDARVTSEGLQKADDDAFFKMLGEMDAAIVEQVNHEAELRARLAEQQDRQSLEALDNYRNAERMKQDLVDETVLTMLEGDQRVLAEMEINHDRRVQMIQDAKFETEEQYVSAMSAEALLFAEEQKRYKLTRSFSYKINQDMKQIGDTAQQAFASGLADAMVSAFEEGDKAFQKFAANFLRQISEMILQALILRAVQGITGSIFGGGGGGVKGGVSGSGAAFAGYAANGGQFVNKFANGGIAELASPTYFPRFNVLAGEAGREVMTVLARPSFERINGVPAQIGYAGGNRLAITSADALAGAGGGPMNGSAVIRVELAPGMIASIKEQSIQGARIQIVQDMSNDSQLSRITRQKVS